VQEKKRGAQAGSRGSQTGHVTYPCSRASATCLKYERSASGIRRTHAQSVRWKRREPRWAQRGSAGSTVAVPAGALSAAASGSPPDGMIVAVGGAVSTVGTVEGWPTGSDSFRLRFVSTVWRNSSLARRSSRSVRPSIFPSSGSFEGPKTSSAMTPITTNSWSPMSNMTEARVPSRLGYATAAARAGADADRLGEPAAPGQELTALERQSRVHVRRDERCAGRRGARSRGEPLVREVEVVADGDDGGAPVVLRLDDHVARARDRLAELGGADDEHTRGPEPSGDHPADDLERRQRVLGERDAVRVEPPANVLRRRA